jgi:PLD-like domain
LLALIAEPCRTDPAPVIHYAPGENLEHIDVALIDTAQREIDFAAYVLTDWPVIQALTRAADRGVVIRIYLDGTQLAEREPAKVFNNLAETPGASRLGSNTRPAPRCISRPTKLTASCCAPAPRTFRPPDLSARTTI